MAKVLLVDTNFSAQPIFDAITRMGHEVHVVGNNPNDCLAKMCPHYWNLNYANINELAELVEREKFDFMVPGCTDRSYRSCAEVSKGRFPGIDSAEQEQLLNQKARFRSLAMELGLPVPILQWQDSSEKNIIALPEVDELRWPVVVKPVDGFSGKGVSILKQANANALKHAVEAARDASACGQCLIEDFIEGQLHSHSAHLQSGRVVCDVLVEEHCTANPYVVDTSWVLHIVSDSLRQRLRDAIETLAQHVQMSDGLIHTQFILQDEQPWLIEVTRRCPGDLYSQLIELSGYPGYVDRYIGPFLGLPAPEELQPQQVHILRHTLTVNVEQSFSNLQFREPLHMVRWVPLCLTGDRLHASPASRIGIMFVKASGSEAFNQLCAAALGRELYQVVH